VGHFRAIQPVLPALACPLHAESGSVRGATAERRRRERELVIAAEQLKRYRLHESTAHFAPEANPAA